MCYANAGANCIGDTTARAVLFARIGFPLSLTTYLVVGLHISKNGPFV